MKECENKGDCKEGCTVCELCGAPCGMVNDECEGCCGNNGCVPYGRLKEEAPSYYQGI